MIKYSVFINRLLTITLLLGVIGIFIISAQVFLIAFASILLSVFLCKCCDKLKKWFNVNHSIALSITSLIIVVIITVSCILLTPVLKSQVREIRETLPTAIERVKEEIQQTSWGAQLIKETSSPDDMFESGRKDIISRTTGIFSRTLSAITNIILILVIGVFLASNPQWYVNGFLAFFSGEKKEKATAVIENSYNMLGAWLKGKFLSMFVVGISTYFGLLLLDMPFAIVLALIAFVFSFIPNVGPIIALIPAVLIALLQSTGQAVSVLILYFSIQIVESYFITPFIEKNTVSVPPALSLIWLLLVGTLLGGTGLFLAVPMLVVIMVIVSTIFLPEKQPS